MSVMSLALCLESFGDHSKWSLKRIRVAVRFWEGFEDEMSFGGGGAIQNFDNQQSRAELR